MPGQDRGELAGNRHSSRGAIRLGWTPVARPVDLEAKLELGVVEVIDADIRPRQPAQLRDTSSGERSHGEQRPVGLLSGSDGLLDLLGREDRPALR
jgi:hypothetical protein